MIRALLRVRAAVLTVGLLATSALLAVAAPTAARASGCGSNDVAVAVNFAHWGGSVRLGCVGWSSSLNGVTALQDSGFDLTGTARYGLSFICRIDAHPSAGAPDHENCQQTPSEDKYWSYWHANPGQTSWSYSTLGVASYHPHAGSVDAWTFGAGTAPPFSPASVLPARAPAPTTPRSLAAPKTIARRTTAPASRPGSSGAPAPSTTTSASSGGPSSTGAAATSSSTSSTASARTTTTPGATTSTTVPATSGSSSAGGPEVTCTSTSTIGSTSIAGVCPPTPAIVANTSSAASPAKPGGSPLPTIAGIAVVAALAAGGSGYAWRRRAGTHGD